MWRHGLRVITRSAVVQTFVRRPTPRPAFDMKNLPASSGVGVEGTEDRQGAVAGHPSDLEVGWIARIPALCGVVSGAERLFVRQTVPGGSVSDKTENTSFRQPETEWVIGTSITAS